ncbi:predicted protein [Botrytis cinerea T4]|uniref:Uncharacterized protein n=1 Tax=Botryotinia fuckeliana (strain T4) TaxID=999810 RepID=G2YXJ7_BOTF4|nr:predicted protein [Botrytis cinerea T4]
MLLFQREAMIVRNRHSSFMLTYLQSSYVCVYVCIKTIQRYHQVTFCPRPQKEMERL